MLKRLKRWFWTKYYNQVYSKCDPNVCCCGSEIPPNGNCTFPGLCRSEKEYLITNAVERKVDA